MLYYLIIGMTYAFAAALQPGPFQSYLVSQTLSNGWRRTLPAACAPLLSDGPIIFLAVFLLRQVPPPVISILQGVGGIFLLYLAFNTWKTWCTYSAEAEKQSPSSRKSVLQATLVNFLNPAPYLSWSLVMGPYLLQGWQETPMNAIALLIGFYGSMTVSLMGLIILFAFARKFGRKVNRILIGCSALALTAFGIYQVWLGSTYFWILCI